MVYIYDALTWLSLSALLLTINGPAQATAIGEPQIIVITLKDRAEVSGTNYTVGDLGKIESKDETIVNKLATLKIGKSPRVGYQDRINWQTVRSYIEQEIPGLYHRIQFSGAKVVAVETVGTVLEASTYVDPAREELRRWLNHSYNDYEIRLKGHYKNLQIPRGKVEIETKLRDEAKVSTNMNVWVDILVDGRHYQSMSVGFNVQAFAPVWVAGKGMKKGNVISKGLLRKDYRDIAKLTNAPVDEDQLEEKRLKESLREGEVLVESAIETVPDVSKGEEISIKAQQGAVTVTATAIALEDGNVGDRIRVGKPNTDIEYHAKVTGRKQATINGD